MSVRQESLPVPGSTPAAVATTTAAALSPKCFRIRPSGALLETTPSQPPTSISDLDAVVLDTVREGAWGDAGSARGTQNSATSHGHHRVAKRAWAAARQCNDARPLPLAATVELEVMCSQPCEADRRYFGTQMARRRDHLRGLWPGICLLCLGCRCAPEPSPPDRGGGGAPALTPTPRPHRSAPGRFRSPGERDAGAARRSHPLGPCGCNPKDPLCDCLP
jgi:hypothetical protein